MHYLYHIILEKTSLFHVAGSTLLFRIEAKTAISLALPVTNNSSLSLILSSEPGETLTCTPDLIAIIFTLYLNLGSIERIDNPEYVEPTGTVIVSTDNPLTPSADIFLSFHDFSPCF